MPFSELSRPNFKLQRLPIKEIFYSLFSLPSFLKLCLSLLPGTSHPYPHSMSLLSGPFWKHPSAHYHLNDSAQSYKKRTQFYLFFYPVNHSDSWQETRGINTVTWDNFTRRAFYKPMGKVKGRHGEVVQDSGSGNSVTFPGLKGYVEGVITRIWRESTNSASSWKATANRLQPGREGAAE